MAVVLKSERFVPNQIKDEIYKDLFAATLFDSDTKDLSLITNEDAVKNSIINILLTNVGEKLFNSVFGSEINKLLFENITPQTTSSIISLITSAIENFEPRARLVDITASPLPDENAYAVTIIFSVINKTEPITLEFLLNRVR